MTHGYSTTPQSRKLGLKPRMRVHLEHAAPGWALSDPPPLLDAGPEGAADLIVCFVRAAAEIAPELPRLGARIHPDGTLWIAWPRRAGGHSSDITDSVVREAALPLGLVDVKVAAIDHDWSGLKLVWRRERR